MIFQQKLLEQAYFIFKLTGRAVIQPVSSDERKAPFAAEKSTSGMVTRDEADSYWPIFSLSPVTVPEVFANVNSAQFPSRF